VKRFYPKNVVVVNFKPGVPESLGRPDNL